MGKYIYIYSFGEALVSVFLPTSWQQKETPPPLFCSVFVLLTLTQSTSPKPTGLARGGLRLKEATVERRVLGHARPGGQQRLRWWIPTGFFSLCSPLLCLSRLQPRLMSRLGWEDEVPHLVMAAAGKPALLRRRGRFWSGTVARDSSRLS